MAQVLDFKKYSSDIKLWSPAPIERYVLCGLLHDGGRSHFVTVEATDVVGSDRCFWNLYYLASRRLPRNSDGGRPALELLPDFEVEGLRAFSRSRLDGWSVRALMCRFDGPQFAQLYWPAVAHAMRQTAARAHIFRT